jgi:hypothetical protein
MLVIAGPDPFPASPSPSRRHTRQPSEVAEVVGSHGAIMATAFTSAGYATAEMATDPTIQVGRCSFRPIRVEGAPIVAAEGDQ